MNKLWIVGAAASAFVASGALAQDLMFAPGEGSFDWDSYAAYADAHDYSGQSLSISGPWIGADKDLVESVLNYFRAATGAEVDYSGSDSFETDIVIALQADSASDIAVFPQPGLASDMAARGYLAPISDDVAAWVTENYGAGASWVDLGTYADADGNDQYFAFPFKVDLKSLVWFVPEQFEENGYDVPESMEDLKALTQQIVDDGGTPWCIGLGSGAATGWPATDWVEDLLLRTQPPEVYDGWVTNDVKFTDPRIVAAIEEFGWFALNDDFVNGGAEAVASTDFRDSPAGLFTFPPECYMHRQASFIPTFFPEGTVVGEDVDFFYFPAYASKDLGRPVLGAGTLWAPTTMNDVVAGFYEFLETPIAHEIWMAQSGFLTPFKGANTETYASDALRGQGEILTQATTFRFDGSDLMPGEIGAGAFWTGMVDYTTGKPAAEVAAEIQTRWDSIR